MKHSDFALLSFVTEGLELLSFREVVDLLSYAARPSFSNSWNLVALFAEKPVGNGSFALPMQHSKECALLTILYHPKLNEPSCLIAST
jgi:hypothetical protein